MIDPKIRAVMYMAIDQAKSLQNTGDITQRVIDSILKSGYQITGPGSHTYGIMATDDDTEELYFNGEYLASFNHDEDGSAVMETARDMLERIGQRLQARRVDPEPEEIELGDD